MRRYNMYLEAKILKAMAFVVSAMFFLTIPLNVSAFQHDAEYYELEKQFKDQWLADDKSWQH
jgi:hypothetical protein